MNPNNLKSVKAFIEGYDTKFQLSFYFLDLCLSVVIELLPNGIFVNRFFFYEKGNQIDYSKLDKIRFDRLRIELFEELNEITVSLCENRINIHLIWRSIALIRKPFTAFLGRFWVFKIKSLIYTDKIMMVDTVIMMPRGNVLNIVNEGNPSSFLHSHNDISFFLYGICTRKFNLIIRLVRFIKSLWDVTVLALTLVSSYLLISQILYDFQIDVFLSYFISLSLILLISFLLRQIILNRLKTKITLYINEG